MKKYKRYRPRKLADLFLFEAKYPYKDNKEKSDQFRAWMLKNKSSDAKDPKIDITKKTGSSTWKGLPVAYEKFGAEFEKAEADAESFSDIKKEKEESEEDPDKTSISDSRYKDPGNKAQLDDARAKGADSSKYLGKATRIIAQLARGAVVAPALEVVGTALASMDNTVPLHYQVLLGFLTLRTQNLNFTYGPARRAMHDVAEYAWKKKGKPKGDFPIGYDDYHDVPANKGRPTYARGGGVSIKSPNRDNLYAQLSATFGNCIAKRKSDGTYRIDDQYDFNVLRSKEAREGNPKAMADDIAQAIPSFAETSKAFDKFWTYLTGDKKGKNAAEYLEPLLLQMETQLDYAGLPTSMETQKPEERTSYEKLKTGVKGLFGREEDETLIPGVGIPFLEESKNKSHTLKLTRRQLLNIIKENLK